MPSTPVNNAGSAISMELFPAFAFSFITNLIATNSPFTLIQSESEVSNSILLPLLPFLDSCSQANISCVRISHTV